jgi:hypothetical protein
LVAFFDESLEPAAPESAASAPGSEGCVLSAAVLVALKRLPS